MKCLSLVAIVLIPIVVSQDVTFDGDKNAPVDGGDASTRIEGIGGDVKTRFFNVDLSTFAGQVAASALGSVVGNAGANIAGNYLSGCNSRGKRSVLMHKLEKRQAIDANKKSGNADAEPEVATRLFCPQDFLNQGGSNDEYGQSYCDTCYCSERNCKSDCTKCGNGNNFGWISNSENYNNGQQTHNSGNYNGQNTHIISAYVNCNTCYCKNDSCKKQCNKCQNNTYPTNSGSSWNNNNYNNNGWRSSNSATSEDSEEAKEDRNESSTAPKTENEDAVVFA